MKLKLGMIGGGIGSFIGPVHRMAAQMDGMIEIVSGAFSSKPETSIKSGKNIGLEAERIYADWKTMIRKEKSLPDDIRPDIICIVTPNHLHFEPICEAIQAGFNVVCDKPLCMSLTEANKIKHLIDENDIAFCLTHNYSAYPMVKKAREMVINGKLGQIRTVYSEYLQGWLSEKEELKGNKQAEWRAEPSRAGIAGCMADIGTHAFQLTEYITGKKVRHIFSRLNTIVDGRQLDDDGIVLCEMDDAIKGTILASQVAAGEENNLRIRIYGTKGSLSWEQMHPNSLQVKWIDKHSETYRTATNFEPAGGIVDLHSRLPAGHPEGFIEAFANIYRNFALDLFARKQGKPADKNYDYPGIEDGIRGMSFLEAAVSSSSAGEWKSLENISD